MHLKEFADSGTYEPVAADVGESIGHGSKIDNGSPLTTRLAKQSGDRRRKLIDQWHQDRINRLSRRRHSLLGRASQCGSASRPRAKAGA